MQTLMRFGSCTEFIKKRDDHMTLLVLRQFFSRRNCATISTTFFSFKVELRVRGTCLNEISVDQTTLVSIEDTRIFRRRRHPIIFIPDSA